MSLGPELHARANGACELCGATENLGAYQVPASPSDDTDGHLLVCETCGSQLENPQTIDANHWRCLNDSMWSQVPCVQVMAWRMLNRLSSESWAADQLAMLYLDDETLAWARAGEAASDDEADVVHKDSNGAVLVAGDTVHLIKDLNVKGANFTAKRGTAVRNISLVFDNAKQIEGRISGQQIVILTEFVKKSN